MANNESARPLTASAYLASTNGTPLRPGWLNVYLFELYDEWHKDGDPTRSTSASLTSTDDPSSIHKSTSPRRKFQRTYHDVTALNMVAQTLLCIVGASIHLKHTYDFVMFYKRSFVWFSSCPRIFFGCGRRCRVLLIGREFVLSFVCPLDVCRRGSTGGRCTDRWLLPLHEEATVREMHGDRYIFADFISCV